MPFGICTLFYDFYSTFILIDVYVTVVFMLHRPVNGTNAMIVKINATFSWLCCNTRFYLPTDSHLKFALVDPGS